MAAALRGVLLAGLMAVSACGSSPKAVRLAAPPPDGIDGHYRGIARLMRANIAGCPRSGSRVVNVESGALSLTYRGPTASYALVATVGGGGAIRGSDGRGTIAGQISGRHMDLTVSSEYCEVRYALDRI